MFEYLMIKTFGILLFIGLIISLNLTTVAQIDSTITWNPEIQLEFGSQIIWDTQGYFEPAQGTVQTYETIGIVTSTNENGDTTTYETTGSGTYTTFTDDEFSIEFLSAEIPSFNQFEIGEESTKSHFSMMFKNNEYSLVLEELVVFLFPTLIIDDDGNLIDMFESEATLFEYQDIIRNILNLSNNSIFRYASHTTTPIQISESDGERFLYRSSGILYMYLNGNSTQESWIELDGDYFEEEEEEPVGGPFLVYSILVISTIVVIRKKIISLYGKY